MSLIPHNRSPYKMIAFDLDGTLLDRSLKMAPGSVAVINELIDAGYVVTVASGRRFRSIGELTRGLRLQGLVIANNGGIVRDISTGRLVESHFLGKSEFQLVASILRARSIPFMVTVFDGNPYGADFVYDRLSLSIYHQDVIERHPTTSREVFDLMTGLAEFCILEIYINEMYDRAREVIDLFQKSYEALDAEAKKTYGRVKCHVVKNITSRLNASAAQFYSKEISKWNAVRAVAHRHGISPEAVVVFGDDYNDLEMIERAGLGIAMGNAPPEVRAAAKKVAEGNENGGVEKALRELFYE